MVGVVSQEAVFVGEVFLQFSGIQCQCQIPNLVVERPPPWIHSGIFVTAA